MVLSRTFLSPAHSLVYLEIPKVELTIYLIKHKKSLNFSCIPCLMNMDDLSPAFAAESLTLEIIAELKRRLESTGTYDEQLRIVTEMEDKYDLEEGILLSHFLKFTQSGVEPPHGGWDSDETLMEHLFEDDEDHNCDRPTEEIDRQRSIVAETAKPINVLVPRPKQVKFGSAVSSSSARERENVQFCEMCKKNFISVVSGEKMCGNCVVERKSSSVLKRKPPSPIVPPPQEKIGVNRKGEGSASSLGSDSSPKDKRRDNIGEQLGNRKEALRYTQDCLAAAGWSLEEALPEESVKTYTAHILFPKNQYWEEGVDRALERFRAEMAIQHSLVTKTMLTSGSTSVIRASDIQEWARILAESDILPEAEGRCWEYCRRISNASERELKELLGGNLHAPDNITHLAKLAALVHQQQIARDFLKGVDQAIESLTMDGFDGEPFRQLLRETQDDSPGVLALEFSNGDLEECSVSADGEEDEMSSFISAGGESGLGVARDLIARGAGRAYRAYGNMGYDHVDDAASREGTSSREKSAKIRTSPKALRSSQVSFPEEPATTWSSAHGPSQSPQRDRPVAVTSRFPQSTQPRSSAGRLRPEELLGPSYSPSPRISPPDAAEWSTQPERPLWEVEPPQALSSRSHRVDDLEELRLSMHLSPYQQQGRDRAHMLSIRVRRATVLSGHSDQGSRLITLIDQLSNWQLRSAEYKKKDQVKIAAPPAVVKKEHYDMVSFLNMIASKAVIKNWSIRDMVLELKDGDIIDTPKIKTFVQGLNAEGQRSDRMRSATEYSMQSPAAWVVAEDQSVEASNFTYWIMRMTDLSYILIQRWHEHLSNEELESAMVELPFPDWEDPETLRGLFDRMRNIWSRVDPSRRALSLLEDKMLKVVRFNRDYGPSIKAEYEARRREAMRDELSHLNQEWEATRATAANWVPSADIQMSLWDKVASRLSADEVIYVVPPERIERLQAHDKKTTAPVKKVSSVVTHPEETSNHTEDLLQRFGEMLSNWQAPSGTLGGSSGGSSGDLHTYHTHATYDKRFTQCDNCGGRHFDDDLNIHSKCPRRVKGKWIPSAFYRITPRFVKYGKDSRYSSVYDFWKHNLSRLYPLFAKEPDKVKEEFFSQLKEEDRKRTSDAPTTTTSSAPASPAPASAPKKAMSTMRVVNMSRPRASTTEDTLAMYRVSYLDSSGLKHQGWQQFDPGSMLTLMRKDIAVSMGCKIVPRAIDDQFQICGILPEAVIINEDAIVQMHIKGARRVLELPSNPDNPTPLKLGQGTHDVFMEQPVPLLSELSVPFLMGGQALVGMKMQQHFEDKVLTFHHQGKCYAVPYISWDVAMQEMKECKDTQVLNAHCTELELCQDTKVHVGISKNCVLHQKGTVPIQLGSVARKNLKGWVQVELEDFVDVSYPVAFEPTLCHVSYVHIDAHTSLTQPLLLPAQSVKVKVTPVIIAPTLLTDGKLQGD